MDIQAIRSRAEAASPQPGAVGIYDPSLDPVEIFRQNLAAGDGPCYLVWLPDHPGTVGAYPKPDHAVTSAITGNGPTSKANAELFSSARADILGLSDELLRLQGLVKAYQDALASEMEISVPGSRSDAERKELHRRHALTDEAQDAVLKYRPFASGVTSNSPGTESPQGDLAA